MIENEYALIDEKELKRYRMENPNLDDVELMARLNSLLARQLHRMKEQRCLTLARGVEPLSCFTSLQPTDEQLRTALLRLLEMPCPGDSSKLLVRQKQHWLAIMRVLQFLGVIDTEYAARQRFAEYVNDLLKDSIPPIDASSMKHIESESPFNRPLPEWYGRLHNERARYYWNISLTLLTCISEANIPKFFPN